MCQDLLVQSSHGTAVMMRFVGLKCDERYIGTTQPNVQCLSVRKLESIESDEGSWKSY